MPYKNKEQQREAQKRWAQKQSDEFKKIKYQREYDNKKLMVEKLNNFKLEKGCCELCGESHPACCFDFHHVNELNKKTEVSKLASKGYKWKTIQEEIDKCIMLCALCHRKIHAGLLVLMENSTDGR